MVYIYRKISCYRIACVLLFLLLFSCKNAKKEKISLLMEKWIQKEIVFPNDLIFTIQGEDTIDYVLQDKFKIITYVDSTGCTACKMKLPKWEELITSFDSLGINSVQFLFFFSPQKSTELHYALRTDKFKYPICIDYSDSFNMINHLPNDENFQTFLLDKENRIIAIGNPVNNPKIKELYLRMIRGEKVLAAVKQPQTDVGILYSLINMGEFDWQQEQKAHFTLANTGNSPLAITDVITSCGCTSVEYPKEPVRPGNSVELKVRYKADHPEHFNKTITVYCNTPSSPIKLEIKGTAE